MSSSLDSLTGVRQLTLDQVKKWCEEVTAGRNLESLKYLITAYNVACQYGENPEEQSLFEFSDSSVYTHLMTFILKVPPLSPLFTLSPLRKVKKSSKSTFRWTGKSNCENRIFDKLLSKFNANRILLICNLVHKKKLLLIYFVF